MTESEVSSVPNRRARAIGRVLLGLVPVVALIFGLRASGVLDGIDTESIRDAVSSLGWLGPIGFAFIYVLGVIAHIPGAIFVASAVLAYGPWSGFLVAYLGCQTANLVNYQIARLASRIGGARLAGMAPPGGGGTGRFADALGRLRRSRLWGLIEERPLLGMVAARIIFPTQAAVSFALTLVAPTATHYLIASVLGVVPQLALTVLMFALAFGSS